MLGLAALASAAAWPMVGWDAFRSYDLYSLRTNDTTRMFSSYDRTDKNDDGFAGTYSCLYNTTAGRCVIAEAEGPGQISDIWFTYLNNSVLPVGDIQIKLDEQLVLDAVVQDVVDGKLGVPFVWPLVGNTNDTSGGNVIKVPMPYRKSMQVSTSTNPHFYHVMYRTFPEHVDVNTFNPKEGVTDIIEAFLRFGTQDSKTIRSSDSRAQHKKQSTASELIELEGSGVVDEVQIRIPEILGAMVVTDDGRAFGEGGSSSFEMRVDGSCSRCRLTRRLDKSIGHQKAHVTIDGQDAGYWEDSGASANATWGDQVLEIHPDRTTGKSKVTVQSSFVSSDLDFNEFAYAAHCLPNGSEDWQLTDILNVGWNNQQDEKAHSYSIVKPTWQGLRSMYTYGGEREAGAQNSIDALNDIDIHMEFDGRTTVNLPLGSFFDVALGKNDVRSLLLSVDSLVENGAFTSWFPMPFSDSFKMSLTRTSTGQPVPGSVSVRWHKQDLPAKGWGYFSTEHRRAQTVTGQLWNLLSKPGSGVVYGVTHAIRGSILVPNNTLEFLEGDFQVWYDRTSPGPFKDAAILGTGTEDFYESGWYFADAEAPPYGVVAVPYSMPFGGLTSSLYGMLDCVGSCLSPLRLMLSESLAYDDGISVNIEHGPVGNNVNAEYETTVFYYAP